MLEYRNHTSKPLKLLIKNLEKLISEDFDGIDIDEYKIKLYDFRGAI